MAISILDDPNAFFDGLAEPKDSKEETPQPIGVVAEEKKTAQEVKKTPSILDDPDAFFQNLQTEAPNQNQQAISPQEQLTHDLVVSLSKSGPRSILDVDKQAAGLLDPKDLDSVVQVHPWFYSHLPKEQKDALYNQWEESQTESTPISETAKTAVKGVWEGFALPLLKGTAKVGLDVGYAAVKAPIEQYLQNRAQGISTADPNYKATILDKAKEQIDTDLRDITGTLEHGRSEAVRTAQQFFGGPDLGGTEAMMQLGTAPSLTEQVAANKLAKSGQKPNWTTPAIMAAGRAMDQIGFNSMVSKLAYLASQNPNIGSFTALDNLNRSLGLPDNRREHWENRMAYKAMVGQEDYTASSGETIKMKQEDGTEYDTGMPKHSPWSNVLYSPAGQWFAYQQAKASVGDPAIYAAAHDIPIEQAQKMQEEAAMKLAETQTYETTKRWNKEHDENVEILGTMLLGPAGMGEAGIALGAVGLAKKLGQAAEVAGLSDEAINAIRMAQQARQATILAEKTAQAARPSALSKPFRAAESAQAKVAAALEKIPKPIAKALPVVAKYAGLGGAGAVAGELLSPEDKLGGALKGLTVGLALGTTPGVVRSLDDARMLIAKGRAPWGGGIATTAGKMEGSSGPTKFLFKKTGPVIDYLAKNARPAIAAGVELGVLNGAFSTIKSDSPEKFVESVASGFAMGAGFGLLHRAAALEMRDRAEQDVEIQRSVDRASESTKNNLNQFTNWQNVVEKAKSDVGKMESKLAEAQQKGDAEEISYAQRAVKIANARLSQFMRANVQTRNEYGRQILSQFADVNRIINGARKSGQQNAKIEVLQPIEIAEKLAKQYPGLTPEQALMRANQRGAYDEASATAYVNADHILKRQIYFGETASEALLHESLHIMDDMPEMRELNKKSDELLFDTIERDLRGNITKQTNGKFPDADLFKMYTEKYLEYVPEAEKEAYARASGLWNEQTNSLDPNKVVDYMKKEVRAELGSGILEQGLGKLYGPSAAIDNWLAQRIKNDRLRNAIQRVTGRGVKPFGTELLGVKYDPETIAAKREALRALADYNGEFADAPEVSKGQDIPEKTMRSDPAMRRRYGLFGGEYKTQLYGEVRDADGKLIQRIPIVSPDANEGSWQHSADSNQVQQTRGYGPVPEQIKDVQLPPGGKLDVVRDFAYDIDGKTPIPNKDINQLEIDRGNAIRQALDSADDRYGVVGVVPFSADGLSYKGILSPKQREAIKNIPESILPLSLKEKFFVINDAMASKEGNVFDIDYAARLKGKKYKGRRAEIYSIIPAGLGFSKEGNFYFTSVSRGAWLRKMKAIRETMPGWFEPWNNDPALFERDIQEIYLPNTRAERPGWMGLDPENPTVDTELARIKKNRINAFFSMMDAKTPAANPEAFTVPKSSFAKTRKGKATEGVDNLWRNFRLDAIADMVDTSESTGKYPMNFDRIYQNLMPIDESGNVDVSRLTPEMKATMEKETIEPEKGVGFGVQFMPAQKDKAAVEGTPLTEKYPTQERGFYSGMQKALDEKLPARATVKQVMDIVSNPQNVKPEELKWSNLGQHFEGRTDVTKEEVLNYLRDEGSIKFEEVEQKENPQKRNEANEEQLSRLGYAVELSPDGLSLVFMDLNSENDFMHAADMRQFGLPEEAVRLAETIEQSFYGPKGAARYGSYQVPGGENYREVVMSMPNTALERAAQNLKEFETQFKSGRIPKDRFPEHDALRQAIVDAKAQEPYISSHFQEVPNYVAHMRLNDRTDAEGQPGTLVEEFQSDLHQEGRKKGYAISEKELAEIKQLTEKARRIGGVIKFDATDAARWKELGDKFEVQGVPDAPFRKDWPVQLFKRALRDAVASGKEWIGWTNGETQAKRYEEALLTQVKHIEWEKNDDDTFNVNIPKPDGSPGIYKEDLTKNELNTLVGKDIAQQIVEGKGRKLPKDGFRDWSVIEGENLVIGGEGMKVFYDNMLPADIGKYLKKLGGAVEKSFVPAAQDAGRGYEIGLEGVSPKGTIPPQEIWKVSITPEMRNAVSKGQTQFMPAQKGEESESKTLATTAQPLTVLSEGRPVGTVESFQEASDKYSMARQQSGLGASALPGVQLADASGKVVANLSYNGKVWPGEKWESGMKPLFDPFAPTAQFMPRVAVVPERFTGTGEEPVVTNKEYQKTKYLPPGARRGAKLNVPPVFQKFDIDQFEKGGKFFDFDTGEEVTGKKYSTGEIDVSTGRPSFTTETEVDAIPPQGRIIRTNLFKKSKGWKWISENPPPTETLISVTKGSDDHFYALKTSFPNGVELARNPEGGSEPRLRPTGRGDLELGQEVGRIVIRGNEHPVYDRIQIGVEPHPMISDEEPGYISTPQVIAKAKTLVGREEFNAKVAEIAYGEGGSPIGDAFSIEMAAREIVADHLAQGGTMKLTRPAQFMPADKEQNKRDLEEAKRIHGVTRSLYEAGYVLPDGSMLDFSGKSQASGYERQPDGTWELKKGERGMPDYLRDSRKMDHREIQYGQGTKIDAADFFEGLYMTDFMRKGAIRIDAKFGLISIHGRQPITSAQKRVLKDLVISANGVRLDLEADDGQRTSLTLESGKWPIVERLLNQWSKGETPEPATQFMPAQKGVDHAIFDELGITARPDKEQEVKVFGNAIVSSPGIVNFLPAYHGTPHEVDPKEGFSLKYVGTGEGNQAFGHGLYYADLRDIAKNYARTLDNSAWKHGKERHPVTGKYRFVAWQEPFMAGVKRTFKTEQEAKEFVDRRNEESSGNVYKVDLDVTGDDLLAWDKPFSQQSPKVQQALATAIQKRTSQEVANDYLNNPRPLGGTLYKLLAGSFMDASTGKTDIQQASELLLGLGVKGIQYFDAGSRQFDLTDQRLLALETQLGSPEAAVDEVMKSVYNTPKVKERMRQTFLKNFPKRTSNYVIFDEGAIKILDKNGEPVEQQLPQSLEQPTTQFMPSKKGEDETPSKIVSAAIRNEETGEIFTGIAHPLIYDNLPASAFKGISEDAVPNYFDGDGWNTPEGFTDGFVDGNGKFYDREEALVQAQKAKQYIPIDRYDDQLESGALLPQANTQFMPARIDSSTSVASLAKDENFEQAKFQGSPLFAAGLVTKYVKPEMVESLRSKIDPSRPAYIVPVITKEGESLNSIPLGLAYHLSQQLGVPIWYDVVKTSTMHNTGASAVDRARNTHVWHGKRPPDDAQIILVDDTYTTGQTLRSLADYVGEPTAVATMAVGRYGKEFDLSPEREQKFLAKAGITRQEFEALYGQTPTATLTGAQAQQYILNGTAGKDGLLSRIPIPAGPRVGQADQQTPRPNPKALVDTGFPPPAETKDIEYAKALEKADAIATVTLFSGVGTWDYALLQDGVIFPRQAVEYDPMKAAAYNAAIGKHVTVADVTKVDPAQFQDNQYLHASPSCKNYSILNPRAAGEPESVMDLNCADAVVDFLKTNKHPVFTLENVPGYRNSESYKKIRQTLVDMGYSFDERVYNAADYGSPTSRNRLIVRAVLGDATLPEPIRKPKKNWYGALTKEQIDSLPDLPLEGKGVRRATSLIDFLKTQGIDAFDVEEPILVASGGSFGQVAYSRMNESAPTFTTAASYRILLPGGISKRVTGRAKADMSGFGKDFVLPENDQLANEVVGNGVPPDLVRAVITPFLRANMHRVPGFENAPKAEPYNLGNKQGSFNFMPAKLRARPLEDIKSEVGGGEIKGGALEFGKFMRQMRDRDLTARDLVKSYTIALSSIQRQQRPVETLKRAWEDAPFEDGSMVRPEDAFAKLLLTPEGKSYLDSAEKGEFDEASAAIIRDRFRPFGYHNKLYDAMKAAAEDFAPKAKEIAAAVRDMPANKFIDFVRENIKGIGMGKIGFWSGQLGRGDIPTFDSRQGKLVYGKEIAATKDVLLKQIQRLTKLDIGVPPELAEFAQTLLHHEVWDRLAGSDSSHGPIKEAMLEEALSKLEPITPKIRPLEGIAKPTVSMMPAPREEQPIVDAKGFAKPKDLEKPFRFTPKMAVNFMPAAGVDLADYQDQPVIALPCDRMGVGQLYVGPTGQKQPLSKKGQGGPGFIKLHRKGIWAFTNRETADRFMGRANSVMEKLGVDSLLIAPTLQSPVNHLKNPTGQKGYVEAMEAAVKAGMLTMKDLDAQVKAISDAIAKSEAVSIKEPSRKKWGNLIDWQTFKNAVSQKQLNFQDTAPFLVQLNRKTLPISAKELEKIGLLPQEIAKDLADDRFFEMPFGSVVALFEVKKNAQPFASPFHDSYPYLVPGKPVGFLKNIYNVGELSSDPRIRNKAGAVQAQPLQTVLPELDRISEVLKDTKSVPIKINPPKKK